MSTYDDLTAARDRDRRHREQEARTAVHRVLAHATDPADARLLLDMLGLLEVAGQMRDTGPRRVARTTVYPQATGWACAAYDRNGRLLGTVTKRTHRAALAEARALLGRTA